MLIRVNLFGVAFSHLSPQPSCIAFTEPAAQNSPHNLCKVEAEQLHQYCLDELSGIKQQKMVQQTCHRYLNHVEEYKESIAFVHPENFITYLEKKPEDDLTIFPLKTS